MIRVLIVDDHAVVRRGLSEILADGRDVEVSETADAPEALELLRGQNFDLAVLDLDLPGKSGFELLDELKRARPRLPVLMLSVYPEDQFAVRALRAGASGFLCKDAAPEELMKAVRKILRGGRYFSEFVAEQLIDLPRPGRQAAHPHEALSKREFQILCLLGAGKSVKEIAAELTLSPPTVSTYRARIMEKMELKTTVQLVRYALKNRLVN